MEIWKQKKTKEEEKRRDGLVCMCFKREKGRKGQEAQSLKSMQGHVKSHSYQLGSSRVVSPQLDVPQARACGFFTPNPFSKIIWIVWIVRLENYKVITHYWLHDTWFIWSDYNWNLMRNERIPFNLQYFLQRFWSRLIFQAFLWSWFNTMEILISMLDIEVPGWRWPNIN